MEGNSFFPLLPPKGLALAIQLIAGLMDAKELPRTTFLGHALNLHVSRATAKRKFEELGQTPRAIRDEEVEMLARSSVKLDGLTVPRIVHAELMRAG